MKAGLFVRTAFLLFARDAHAQACGAHHVVGKSPTRPPSFTRLCLLAFVLSPLFTRLCSHVFVHICVRKELHYHTHAHEERFKSYEEKIIHVVVDLPYVGEAAAGNEWVNEAFQRNAIKDAVDSMQDILGTHVPVQCAHNVPHRIIIADVDELPDPVMLSAIKTGTQAVGAHVDISMDMFYYDFRHLLTSLTWRAPKLLTISRYLTLTREGKTATMIRNELSSTAVTGINTGGWHLSYFGGPAAVLTKVLNFAHQEFRHIEEDLLLARMRAGTDLFDREGVTFDDVTGREEGYVFPPGVEELNLPNLFGHAHA